MRIRALLATLGGAGALFAAAPASASVCDPVTIYFSWNSAAIGEDAREELERLAVRLAWKGPDLDGVILTAHTDSSGSREVNRRIARQRAEAVRDALIDLNVPARLIRLQPLGEAAPRILTPRNARQPLNRRVDVIVQLHAAAQEEQLREQRPIC